MVYAIQTFISSKSDYSDTSNCSSVNCSFWKFQVSAWVRRNSATALVTVDLTGDGSPTKRANKVTWSGSQLNQNIHSSQKTKQKQQVPIEYNARRILNEQWVMYIC